MLIVYKQLENGGIDFSDGITVDSVENIPDGYIQLDTDQTNNPETNVRYKDDGTLMTQEEIDAIKNAPVEPTELEKLQQENEQLKASVIELTTYTAAQEERYNQAILELSQLIAGGNV
ncbi:hypothetical protein MKY04_12535 [Lysinibacillus telephonicus]|uniref:hypothetical protein n=1 Tax=Lysinibacillus telephonicus TaxID=1714840 RepID=UPI0031FD1917